MGESMVFTSLTGSGAGAAVAAGAAAASAGAAAIAGAAATGAAITWAARDKRRLRSPSTYSISDKPALPIVSASFSNKVADTSKEPLVLSVFCAIFLRVLMVLGVSALGQPVIQRVERQNVALGSKARDHAYSGFRQIGRMPECFALINVG